MNCVIAYYCIVTFFVLFSSPVVVVADQGSNTLLEQEHDSSSASRALAKTPIFTCPKKGHHGGHIKFHGVRSRPKKRLYKHRKSLLTIGEIAKKRGFTILEKALTVTGLFKTVHDPHADLTVFAPTDTAFKHLGEAKLKELFAKPELLKKIIKYHVVDCTVTSKSIAAMKTSHIRLPTLSGYFLHVILKLRRIFVKGDGNGHKYLPRVIKKDIKAKNGVIHVIDKVLLPRYFPPHLPTITKWARTNKSLRTLVRFLDVTGLADAAGDANNELTVFAPTNRAFKKLGKDKLNYLLSNPHILKAVLNYHIAGKTTITSEMLFKINSVPTLLKDQYFGKDQCFGVTHKKKKVFLKGKANPRHFKINAVDRKASNGVVHVIDQVLMPTLPIYATFALNGYSLLTKLLKDAGLAAILNDLNQKVNLYTVFAPTDAAFQALGQPKLNDVLADKELLKKILSTHVVVHVVKPGSTAALPTAPASLTTLSGSIIEVYEGERDGVLGLLAKGPGNQFPGKVGAAYVDATYVHATNGFIYGIDHVLLP